MANKFLIVCGGAGVGLLGQRKVLGLAGELQIDAREEIIEKLRHADPNSDHIKLDPPVGTTPVLLLHMKSQIGKSITAPPHIRHTEFLASYWPGDESLKDGLARSPALGGGTIRHDVNLRQLNAKLSTLINEWAIDIGEENPVEVWIVSSTCGGTGEGIHRFVADRLVKLLTTKEGAHVKLSFIRIGQSTYRAVDADRTGLNTFFGVAADAAFKMKLPRDYPGMAVTTHWYYLELPPVGVGPAAIPVRARLVEMASKGLMLEELSKSLNTIVVNDGIGLIRVGFWGRDFEENVKYYQTLDQLATELKDLIEPDYFSKYVFGKPEPSFQAGEQAEKVLDQLRDHEYLRSKMESEAWRFRRYGERTRPRDRERMSRHIQRWKTNIDELIAPQSIEEFKPRFTTLQRVKREGEEGELEWMDQTVPLSVLGLEPSIEPFSENWFGRIENAQWVKAWCSKLLGTDSTGVTAEGLLAELHKLARECSHAQHRFDPRAGTAQRARDLAEHLSEFVETLVKVDHLQQLEDAATHLLDAQLQDPKKVLDYTIRQRKIAKGAVEGIGYSPVLAAGLSDVLDRLSGRTWLADLELAVRREDDGLFRSEVLKGATGLTAAGLVSVLGLRPNADPSETQNALRHQMGRMYDADENEFEAQWWQAKEPPGILKRIRYRILPTLEDTIRAGLGDSDGQIKYLYARFGVIGLYVLAFEGVMISAPQDMVTTPTYLLRSFVPLLRSYLEDWQDPRFPGERNNKLIVASAGVGGEPLYEPALRAAGLADEELEKIKEFYQLYRGEQERPRRTRKKAKT